MPAYDYDYFVIGAGSGGVRSARIAGQHGARVAVAEERYYGGTCVNVGCIPKKLLVTAAHFSDDFADARGFGWTLGEEPRHDWKALIANKNVEIERLNGIYRRLLEGAGCTLYDRRATLVDAHTVAVGDDRVTADKILIATGGWPVLPDIPGVKEHAFTSNEAFFLERMPQHVVIVGGGYIAVEFANIFHGLGAQVTLVHRGPLFLAGFDQDLREHLASEMRRAGIDLRFATNVVRVEKTGTCLVADLTDKTMVEADGVMFATGRRPNTAGLGLEAVGVATNEKGAVRVDEDLRTTVPNIFAIGDVNDRINLTPVALAEGHALADTLFGGRPRRLSYANIPTAVFSDPPIGTVGLTEVKAREAGARIDIYRSIFAPLRHRLSGRDQKTVVKLVVDRATDRVLGCHMCGPDAPEIVQGFAVALVCGATKAQFDATIGIHPTSAEELVTIRDKSPVPTLEEEEEGSDVGEV